MENAYKGIGEKIKEQRLKKGLTQRELAGEKITRNMLSLIESGNASPSIPTLVYISERLGIPIAYFFSATDEDVAVFRKMSVISELKESFKNRKYSECTAICSALPERAVDDEVAYILALTHIGLAEERAQDLEILLAMRELDTASAFAERSLYCDDKLTSSISYLRELYSAVCSDSVSDVLCDLSYCSQFISADIIRYFSTIKSLAGDGAACYTFTSGSYFYKHIFALKLVADGKINEAQKRLRDLSLDPETPYFMQYRVLSDLENAANISGDYRLAYSSSRRRIEFIKRNQI